MANKEIEVSIVIPTYNGGEYFKECLQMIFKQKVQFQFEVIIVDSGSTDGTLDLLKDYNIRLKHVRPEQFNHGLTRNTGVQLSKGKYIVLMGQDATPTDASWLQKIWENFDDQLVAGVYCRQIPREDADVLTKKQLNNWVTGRKERTVNFIENPAEYHALQPMEKLILCTFDDVCACVRRKVWEKIPYEETYFAEDLEWGKKVIESGYKIVYEPAAAVIHSHNRSVFYEYKRTYLCHRRLFELIGLVCVPSLSHAIKCSILNIINESPFVYANEPNLRRKFSLLFRLPVLSFASVFGQYLGAKDQRLGKPLKKFRGI